MGFLVDSPWASVGQGLKEGAGAFADALTNYRNQQEKERMLKEQEQRELSSYKEKLAFQDALQVSQQQRKSDAFNSALQEAMNAGGFETPAGQQAFALAYGKGGGNPIEALKLFDKKGKQSRTPFENEVSKQMASSVLSYLEDPDTSQKALANNINYLKENIDKVGRTKGITSGEFLWSGKEFTEYRNRGNLALDSVIKIFNKAGVLPQRKLEWIRETFGIDPFDTQDQIRGKIGSLEPLIKAASEYQEGLGGLIEKYGSDIPVSEYLKLKNSYKQKADKLTESYDEAVASPQPENIVATLPKTAKKGTIATNSESGEKYQFNGERWVKLK